MKNPKISLLVTAAMILLAFTIGLFLGRNARGGDISISFPEEKRQISSVYTAPQVDPVSSSSLVDINTASYEELMTLPGIGKGLALEIISYRASNGGFSYVEELMNVPGIGESRLEALLNNIVVGGNP